MPVWTAPLLGQSQGHFKKTLPSGTGPVSVHDPATGDATMKRYQKTRLTLDLPSGLCQKVDRLATKKQMTKTAVIRGLIEQGLTPDPQSRPGYERTIRKTGTGLDLQ